MTRWWILKPGFADQANGIRLFSSEDALCAFNGRAVLISRRAIFESFEDDEGDDEVQDEESDEKVLPERPMDMLHSAVDGLADTAVRLGSPTDDEGDHSRGAGDPTDDAVMAAQLRHWVIQVCHTIAPSRSSPYFRNISSLRCFSISRKHKTYWLMT